ncbi:hypothetical protein TSAR_001794 [Trichomalopsis sarcophagae]|uniref:Uncharacterized protein n=1 Tax=Trichomalopsis sarcophagae TaxID=543379 RepID=A0A232EHC6_9HYME|nr:hypothetical protein TSAR_001794 [Trichomalopsis sarcophagae]
MYARRNKILFGNNSLPYLQKGKRAKVMNTESTSSQNKLLTILLGCTLASIAYIKDRNFYFDWKRQIVAFN